jgi:hypothetical protein
MELNLVLHGSIDSGSVRMSNLVKPLPTGDTMGLETLLIVIVVIILILALVNYL